MCWTRSRELKVGSLRVVIKKMRERVRPRVLKPDLHTPMIILVMSLRTKQWDGFQISKSPDAFRNKIAKCLLLFPLLQPDFLTMYPVEAGKLNHQVLQADKHPAMRCGPPIETHLTQVDRGSFSHRTPAQAAPREATLPQTWRAMHVNSSRRDLTLPQPFANAKHPTVCPRIVPGFRV